MGIARPAAAAPRWRPPRPPGTAGPPRPPAQGPTPAPPRCPTGSHGRAPAPLPAPPGAAGWPLGAGVQRRQGSGLLRYRTGAVAHSTNHLYDDKLELMPAVVRVTSPLLAYTPSPETPTAPSDDARCIPEAERLRLWRLSLLSGSRRADTPPPAPPSDTLPSAPLVRTSREPPRPDADLRRSPTAPTSAASGRMPRADGDHGAPPAPPPPAPPKPRWLGPMACPVGPIGPESKGDDTVSPAPARPSMLKLDRRRWCSATTPPRPPAC